MSAYEELIRMLSRLETEQINQNTINIDRLSPLEIATKINAEDRTVAGVVEGQLPQIARAAEVFAETIRKGGRVFYIGAGTSGRLGVLDAAECPPTFGTDPGRIVGVISGGYETLVLSREGVEDREDEAVADLKEHKLSGRDFVIGLAASRRTPYTLAGLRFAKSIGCTTAFVICNRWDPRKSERHNPDIVIQLPVGPEVITGSTRMKSGTAQKLTLNTISTTAMVLLGKTYGNLMVDLQARSDKLAARSRKILMDLFDMPLDVANRLLEQSEGSVKLAIAMFKLGCDAEAARRELDRVGGFISKLEEGSE
ncbi:MAG: N-acetylmuramic acid 6-phosphate etherase [Candidatus Zixiibacteriota bacterium]|nr:MAG: N-acetylmuramic acid 6-phosphate etherase [candidate division Zixibacteria bacterium]